MSKGLQKRGETIVLLGNREQGRKGALFSTNSCSLGPRPWDELAQSKEKA